MALSSCQNKRRMTSLNCNICEALVDDEDHRLRRLWCGHSACSTCIRALIYQGTIECFFCHKIFKVTKPEDVPLNMENMKSFKAYKNNDIFEEDDCTDDDIAKHKEDEFPKDDSKSNHDLQDNLSETKSPPPESNSDDPQPTVEMAKDYHPTSDSQSPEYLKIEMEAAEQHISNTSLAIQQTEESSFEEEIKDDTIDGLDYGPIPPRITCFIHNCPIEHRCLSCKVWTCRTCLDFHKEQKSCRVVGSRDAGIIIIPLKNT
ncbi:unnamed protein product [Meganyctiphanes norvegica]|uniref:RING-type domain-containing protein n=1 Tax=Meganyctiphanes norvegica TaxID=48144 RepID=A0AAV2RM31_MEGNR